MRTRTPATALAAAVLAVATALTGCGASSQTAAAPAAEQVKELRYQGGANGVTLAELAEDLGYLGDVELKWVGNTTSGPQDIQSAASGATEFGGAFDGAVAKLVASGAPVQAVITYYGSDEKAYNGFFVLDGSPIREARDLIGKKIGMNTVGGHAEAVLHTYLQDAGLSADDIKKVELVPLPPVNLEQSLRAGQIDVAVLGGQLRDQIVANGGVHQLLTDSQFFGNFNGGTIVFRDDFIAENPDTVRTFVSGVAKAIEWTRTTPHDEVIARYTKIIEGRGRNESTESLKYWWSTGIATPGGVIADEDFTRWEDWLVDTGAVEEGELEPSEIYTNEFNPYAKEG